MRLKIALLLLFLFGATATGYAYSINSTNYTRAYANASIANATSYINKINESSYLIFTPDLRQAYSYLNKSELLMNTSPSTSIFYSELAVSSARMAYQKIGAYREVGALFISLFTIAVAAVLYRFMQPVKKK